MSTAHIRGQSGSCCVGSEVTLQNVTGCLYTLEVSYRHVSGDGSRRGVRPSELATWGSCILAVEYSVEYDAATLGKGHYKKQKGLISMLRVQKRGMLRVQERGED